MMPLRGLPPLLVALLACGASLTAGILAPVFVGDENLVTVGDSLQPLQTVPRADIDALGARVAGDAFWSRGIPTPGEMPEESAEVAEGSVPARPGVFKYLRLVAILQEPELEAVFRPEKMPEAMRDLMVSLPDQAGMLRVRQGSEVAAGWRVESISPDHVFISGEGVELPVEYSLFEW